MTQRMHQLFSDSGLLSRHERIPAETVLRELREHYGLEGALEAIDTEKDSTFRLRGGERDRLVKVSPPDEPVPVVRCQTDVIDWVERADPGIPVQSVVPALDGSRHRLLHDRDGRFLGVLRVLDFIPGRMLGETRPTPAQAAEVGAMLARVDVALRGFAHEGLERPMVWDIGRFEVLEPLLDSETDPARRELAAQVFAHYRSRLAPALPRLPAQVIHGDFSAFNAVVDPDGDPFVTGVIDFGDVQRGPVIFDPAVLLANHLLPAPEHPWARAREMLAGYLRVVPLSDEEIELLAVASLARVVMRVLVLNWRMTHVPERADYLRTHAREDWARIENACAYDLDRAGAFLRSAREEAGMPPARPAAP